MKTIRIYNEDLEYTFTYDLNKLYKLYEDNKLIHEITDTGDTFIFNGKEFHYHEFADLFIFFKCIHEVDKKMIGELDAVTEQLIFKI
jgi:hypothetical protein